MYVYFQFFKTTKKVVLNFSAIVSTNFCDLPLEETLNDSLLNLTVTVTPKVRIHDTLKKFNS